MAARWKSKRSRTARSRSITGIPTTCARCIKIRGRYQDFALLETPILGILTRASRIATNVYEVLRVCNGKPVLFFPARFDLPEVQAVDGYAYWLAVQRYNCENESAADARRSAPTRRARGGAAKAAELFRTR